MLISNQLLLFNYFLLSRTLLLGDIYQLKGLLSLKIGKQLHVCKHSIRLRNTKGFAKYFEFSN